MKAALYARVGTFDQEPENQRQELRRYAEARGWASTEYVDRGISGSKDHRPTLDRLLDDARRRRFDVLVCCRLDRLGRNLKHLITLLDELRALGVAFVSLAEGIDATTPAGKLQVHILGPLPSSSGNGFESVCWRVCTALAHKAGDSDVQNGRLPKTDSLPFGALACAKRLRNWASPPPQPTAGCLKNPSRNWPDDLTEIRINRSLREGAPCLTKQMFSRPDGCFRESSHGRSH
jgi:hypothetical protein